MTKKGPEQSEDMFRTLAELSLSGICIVQDLKFKYVNPAVARTTTYMVIDSYKRHHDYNPLREELDWRM